MKTEHPDAILVWFGTNPASDDYLGLGLDDGLVKVMFILDLRLDDRLVQVLAGLVWH